MWTNPKTSLAILTAVCFALYFGLQVVARCDDVADKSSIPIFNGSDLSGWEHGDNWIVSDGQIASRGLGSSLTYRSAKMPESFELRYEWMDLAPVKNAKNGQGAGIFPVGLFSIAYRSTPITKTGRGRTETTYSGEIAFQLSLGKGSLSFISDKIDLADQSDFASHSFSLAPGRPVSVPAGRWNTGRIVWKRNTIEQWINEKRVAEIDLESAAKIEPNKKLFELASRFKSNGLYLQLKNDDGSLRFRNITLRSLNSDPLR